MIFSYLHVTTRGKSQNLALASGKAGRKLPLAYFSRLASSQSLARLGSNTM